MFTFYYFFIKLSCRKRKSKELHTVDAIIATKIVNVDKNLEEDEIVIPVPRILLER